MKNCEKATYLVEKGQMTKLSFGERVKLKFHTAMCSCCKHYSLDSMILNKVLKQARNQSVQQLSEEDKVRLKTSLEQI